VSTTTTVNPRLKALTEAGVSVWLDQIRRSMLEGGELARMIAKESLRGMASNPSIFEKAILGSTDHDDELEAMAREQLDAKAIYDRIAVRDVQLAADVLAGVHRESNGRDGFASLEVAPDMAHDSDRTIDAARTYWQALDRRNLMIKIPGTPEGVSAIEQARYEGINVNVTLLFAASAYERVAEAFLRGLERRQADGKPLDVHSVASVFVSRVDPNYPGTMYVDELVGRDTVNTMPMATLHAVADHSTVTGLTAEHDPAPDLQAVAEAGIDVDQVTDELLIDGVQQFGDAMDRLLAGIDERRVAVATGRPPTIQGKLPPRFAGTGCRARAASSIREGRPARMAPRCVAVGRTGCSGDRGSPRLADRVGDDARARIRAERIRGGVPRGGLHRRGAAGHGWLLARARGDPAFVRRGPRRPALAVLDSTHPDVVLRVQESVDVEKTLFIVSSKSGGTIKTLSHYRHFAALAAPNQFVVVTDPGSPLERLAQDDGLRRCFLNQPDIGGRYSVLSLFGLVPAALMGVNIEALLYRCQVAERNCAHYESSESNSGLWLGSVVGELARQGRDKLTFFVSPPIESFGVWVEQLVAESTGKHGRGIPPGDDELRALLADARPPHYVAIMGYLPPSEELDDAVAELREAVRAATGAATTFGHGPRFLHSTGHLHKGGPPNGRFLQLVSDPQRDAEIPGARYSFGTLIAAQAAGDLQTLGEHDLPAERVKLEGEPTAAVRALSERITGLLSGSRRTTVRSNRCR
jgi:transaldolase / glucose-6-phosphate isomerase